MPHFIKNMPLKMFSRTQLCVTEIHDSVDTLQTVVLIAEHATPAVFPQAKIDDRDDHHEYLEDQLDQGSAIDNELGDLGSQITDEDLLTQEDDGEENELSMYPKRRKTMDLYIKEREGKLNADCQSRSPMPSTGAEPPPGHGGRRGRQRQARLMGASSLVGASEAGGGRRGQWGP